MLLEKQNQIDSFNWMSGKKFAINSFQLVCFHAFYDLKIGKYEMNDLCLADWIEWSIPTVILLTVLLYSHEQTERQRETD